VIITSFRIVKRERAAACFDGEGARLFGGRWNSKGKRLVYTSASQSLAILEMLVHLDSQEVLARTYCVRTTTFDGALCENLRPSVLPKGWDGDMPINATRDIGDKWFAESRSAVLAVPSAISAAEQNYLLNPDHPDFRKIIQGPLQDFAFSRRLLK
jgi:RES domain-containing protein